MLFLVRQRREAMFHPDALKNELWGDPSRGIRGYPLAHKGEIELALAEAWTWLMVQGLVLPAEGMNGNNGDRRLSRRAHRMESEAEFASFKARLLPREILHPKIADTVWRAFMRGTEIHELLPRKCRHCAGGPHEVQGQPRTVPGGAACRGVLERSQRVDRSGTAVPGR